MARFILKNIAKGVLIANLQLMLVYFSCFKGYRNSHLLFWHLPSTYAGVLYGVTGVQPLFDAYMFHKCVLPLSVLQEPEMQGLSAKQRAFAIDVCSLCFVDDLKF